MAFVLSNPEENKRKLEELAKSEEGARAIRDFDLEFKFRGELLEARKKANLTQKEVAEKSGLKQQAVSRLENGHQNRGVTLPVLLRYVDALGMNLSLQKTTNKLAVSDKRPPTLL